MSFCRFRTHPRSHPEAPAPLDYPLDLPLVHLPDGCKPTRNRLQTAITNKHFNFYFNYYYYLIFTFAILLLLLLITLLIKYIQFIGNDVTVSDLIYLFFLTHNCLIVRWMWLPRIFRMNLCAVREAAKLVGLGESVEKMTSAKSRSEKLVVRTQVCQWHARASPIHADQMDANSHHNTCAINRHSDKLISIRLQPNTNQSMHNTTNRQNTPNYIPIQLHK